MIGRVYSRLKRSLSTRLLLVFILTSLLLEILLVVGLLHGFSSQWRASVRPHLEQYLDYVSADLGNPPDPERAREIASRLPVNIHIEGPDMEFSSSGTRLQTDGLVFHKPHSLPQRKYRGRHKKELVNEEEIGFNDSRERTILRTKIGDYLVYYELPHNGARRHGDRFMWLALCCVIAILTACFYVVRRMLRPVRDIRDGVKRMGQGEFSHRVPIRSDNDLGELAGSINTMAGDIEVMLEAKRQLLLGASHELRSPLTRARVAVELVEQHDVRGSLQEDLAEMESLITDILESERMNVGHAALNQEKVDLSRLIESVLQEMQAGDIRKSLADDLPPVYVDEKRVRLLLRSLINNAIEHGSGGTERDRNDPAPIIIAERFADRVRVRVIDEGPGIEPGLLDKVTEPFYRTDESRARNTGGFGLGLHLARLIVEAHGGQLLIESYLESTDTAQIGAVQTPGTRVSFDLPVAKGL